MSDGALSFYQHRFDRATEFKNKNQRQKDTIRSLQHKLTNTERELQENKDLSYSLCREFIVAQVSSMKADRLSISDVKDKVNALNSKIFDASASLGDALVHFRYELAKEDWEATFSQVCRTVSEPLARDLVKETQKPGPEVNPLLVQVVHEMYLVHFCSSKIESWFPGTRDMSDLLASIYTEIRQSGEFVIVRYSLSILPDIFLRGTGCLRQMAGADSRSYPFNFSDMERRIYHGSWTYLQDRWLDYQKSKQFKFSRTGAPCHFQSSRGFEAGVGREGYIR